jgi:hypothetical protein
MEKLSRLESEVLRAIALELAAGTDTLEIQRSLACVKCEERTVSVPVRARRARDKQWHGKSIPAG